MALNRSALQILLMASVTSGSHSTLIIHFAITALITQALAEEDPDLPGAVPEGGAGTEEGASEPRDEAADRAPADDAAGGEAGAVGGPAAGGASSASDVTSGVGEGGRLVGDFARGKRLCKLLRVLNSAATVRTMDVFQLRVTAMSLLVLVAHIAAFAAILAGLAKEEANLRDVDAAGEVGGGRCGCVQGRYVQCWLLSPQCRRWHYGPTCDPCSRLSPLISTPLTQTPRALHPPGHVNDALHRACSYARIIEAAQRDYGYAPADMPAYASLMETELDR